MKWFLRRCIKSIHGCLCFFYTPFALLLRLAGVRVLDINFNAIGHLAIEPDIYLRECKLLNKTYFTILLPPRSPLQKSFSFKLEVANPFLLKCWSRHFYVIKNPLLYLFFLPLLRSPLLQINPRGYLATKTFIFHDKDREASVIYNKFNERFETIEPFIRLTKKELSQGKKQLERLGIPPNAWFACFSCREPGHYSQDSLVWGSCRNATIDHLELALQEIIRRGGWCIRMGSPAAAPLPPSLQRYPQVIDYPHTEVVSDFMDIFLASSCRFFLGNNSGITVTASIFGVPAIYTNVVPFGERPIFNNTLSLFKLHRSKTSGQLLPFYQCLQSHLSNSISLDDYEAFQVELVENTPEEIYDVVKEMLDRLDGHLIPLPEEQILQEKFLSLLTPFNVGFQSKSKLGRDFLIKYKHLLHRL